MAGEVGMLGRGDVDCCAEMMGPVLSIDREERQPRDRKRKRKSTARGTMLPNFQ